MSWKLVVLAAVLILAAVAIILVPTASDAAKAAAVSLLLAIGTAAPSWLKAYAPPVAGKDGAS